MINNKEVETKIITVLNEASLSGSILEPAAGKGELTKLVREVAAFAYHKIDIDCIEKDPNNIASLKDEGYRVIHNDFEKFNTFKHYDFIVMNPPQTKLYLFLKKAINLMENGGNIICIMSFDEFMSPKTAEEHELLRYIMHESTYEINMFDESSTIINSNSPKIGSLKISFDKPKKVSYFKTMVERNAGFKEVDAEYSLAKNDYIAQLTKQFDKEAEIGVKFIREYKAVSSSLNSEVLYNKATKPIFGLTIHDKYSGKYEDDVSENQFLERLRLKYWETLFAHPDFTSKLTSEMKFSLEDSLKDLRNYDFSYYNVKTLQIEMTGTLIGSIEKTVLEVFDELSNQYSYSDFSKNIHYYNGWKTNKAWYVNKKVIIPFRGLSQFGGVSLDKYRILNRFNDYEKALNFLNGNKPLKINLSETIDKAIKDGQIKDIEFNFFRVSFFKTGTAWIYFKDLELLKRLNLFAGQRKGWLPPSYGKKSYSDMSKEEKEIIDSFEGEKSYKKVYEEPSKYIFESIINKPQELELH
ncbi:DUF4942 domain-containing protein [Lactococcus lactis]|uniref:class I SAM-dependent methyltransferase n=1 Tax=Lactococcus lactis TaxID=1358 RepID=UPI002892186C|nr:DUF4942 domain-containing protein [Lactococcus lactis]MDT2909290.1 DUF4942 domain-containing protein [Lactococcus lactis]MDT2925180.1 DUF4942 domain-containing protein [Lactococcus lactis]MDT2952039.1 DUF4942 domain-containing protein [Lactococcus lactis]